MSFRWFTARLVFWPTLAWNVLLGRILRIRPWWSRVNERIIIGALPFVSDVADMRNEGVAAVVNMCEEYEGPIAAYEASGIVQLRLRTVDFTSPSFADLQQGVDFIEKHTQSHQSVYVHCKAGRGRSATMVLCWLVAKEGMTPEDAFVFLKQQRPHVCQIAMRPVVYEFQEPKSPDAAAK